MPITPGLDSRDAFEAATSAQEQRMAAEQEKTRVEDLVGTIHVNSLFHTCSPCKFLNVDGIDIYM